MKKILMSAPWLADFGHGIVLTIIWLSVFNIEPEFYYFALGILFSIILDFDGLLEFIKFKNIGASKGGASDHRDGLHYPIIWLVVGSIIIYFNQFIGLLFLTAIFAHFINDSWGTGWGIQWLWPFSKNSYKFFSNKEEDASTRLTGLVVSWSPEEKQEMMEQYGNPNWLNDIYFKLTKISVIEYGTFIISIVLLLVYLSF